VRAKHKHRYQNATAYDVFTLIKKGKFIIHRSNLNIRLWNGVTSGKVGHYTMHANGLSKLLFDSET